MCSGAGGCVWIRRRAGVDQGLGTGAPRTYAPLARAIQAWSCRQAPRIAAHRYGESGDRRFCRRHGWNWSRPTARRNLQPARRCRTSLPVSCAGRLRRRSGRRVRQSPTSRPYERSTVSGRRSPWWKVPSRVSPVVRCQMQLADQPDGLRDQERISPGNTLLVQLCARWWISGCLDLNCAAQRIRSS